MSIKGFKKNGEIHKYDYNSLDNLPTIPEGGGATDEQIAQAVEDYMTENPVSGGANEEQIAQIEKNKKDIANLKIDLRYGEGTLVPFYPETSYEVEVGDMSIRGEKLNSYDWCRRKRFDCKDCVKVNTGKIMHDTMTPFIVFFDSNDVVLSYEIAKTATAITYELDIPVGTRYFYLMCGNNSFNVSLYKLVGAENLVGVLGNIADYGYEYPYLLPNMVSYDVESGGIDNDGSKTDWNWVLRKKYECLGDRRILVTRGWHDLTTPVIAFYDANDNFISAGYNTEIQPMVENFISPPNTAYFYLIVTNARFNAEAYAREYKVVAGRDSWYKGKIASALGDSNTEGGEYFHYVKEYLKLASYKNCGISGTGLIYGDDAMWQDVRINSLDIDSDIITFLGGTNDVYRIADIEDSDFTISNCDTSNFVGAYNVALSKIFYKYFNIDGYYTDIDYSGVVRTDNFRDPASFMVVLIAPPKRFDSAENNASEKVEKINGYVKRIAEMWGLPCVDANETRLNACNKAAIWGGKGDWLHPPYKWHKILARLIVSKLMENEPI